MASPFDTDAIRKETLWFQVPRSGTDIDANGNVIEITETLEVKAFLKAKTPPSGSALDRALSPGADTTDETFAGYCINPQTLPETITTGAIADATIGGAVGEFELIRPSKSAFPVITDVLGDNIEGVFRR